MPRAYPFPGSKQAYYHACSLPLLLAIPAFDTEIFVLLVGRGDEFQQQFDLTMATAASVPATLAGGTADLAGGVVKATHMGAGVYEVQ